MTSTLSREWSSGAGTGLPGSFPPSDTVRANRRRLRVFLGTLIVALITSLAYTFLRPAEYRATTRVEITPAVGTVPYVPSTGPIADNTTDSPKPFLTEVQVLTSRPVLEQAASRLQRAGRDLSLFGSDTVAGIQARLEATPVASTNVVELVATGPVAELTAPLLNAIVDVYREDLAEAYRSSSGEIMAGANDEVNKLQAAVAAKRQDVEGFRRRYNIVSLERGENEVLARVKNLSTALSNANEKQAAAEGKYRSLAESAAAGKAVVRAKDDPTLANLEQRASQAREDLRDLERGYTQDYLAKEPRAVALRTRIAELDRQIKVQRETSQQAALLEAQQEMASAQEAVNRIQGQIAGGRQQVGEFTARFNEYKARQDELAELETAYRAAVQRKVKLEASEKARMPTMKVLEPAVTPQLPWRPLYWRDAALAVAGSLVLALLAMWLVELFNRSEPQPAVVIQQSLGGLPYQTMPQLLPTGGVPAPALAANATPLLPQQPTLPRELSHEETLALLRAADDPDRIAMMLLLSGVGPDELLELRWGDIDRAQRLLRVDGESAREVVLPDSLLRLLGAMAGRDPAEKLTGTKDQPATREDLDARILYAAHDAGIESAAGVTADCLRHTYIACLVRQGIRFADLAKIVGSLPRDVLGQYSALSPSGSRAAREAIDTVLPAVRQLIPSNRGS